MYVLTAVQEKCSVAEMDMALQNVVLLQEPFYRELLAALPQKQKLVLYAIVKEREAKNVASKSFIDKYKLESASSVQTAIKGLYAKDILVKTDDVWRVYDVFFAHYIMRYML